MKEAINVPMAVDACGVDGRAEGLKSMMQRLEMCQKSLNEYLDMKKKVWSGRQAWLSVYIARIQTGLLSRTKEQKALSFTR